VAGTLAQQPHRFEVHPSGRPRGDFASGWPKTPPGPEDAAAVLEEGALNRPSAGSRRGRNRSDDHHVVTWRSAARPTRQLPRPR